MGKLGWTEYEYYTSSPCMFFAACEGYFDKQKDWVEIMRRVALFASQRSGDDFNKLWPSGNQDETVKKVWGITEDDAKKTRDEIMESHNIVLK